jgi:SAM-dependent methyltransferase|tara:strand:- start:1335 stop:1949 length:615 start_codon:yes stop_codon:yes gene_type:complete
VNCTPHYLQPYQDAVKTFGGTFDATLWQSKEGQLIRFEVFRAFVDFTNCSILDVGCGIGDFAQFLVDNKVAFDSFYGIDAMEEMIVTATNRSIECSNFSTVDIVTSLEEIPKAEWITCSGTLNAMGEELAIRTIDALFEQCNVGLAFNFLSDQSGRDPESESLEPATRFNTVGILKHVFTKTPLISFTQTYLNGHDATIVMRKL